ncbi:MAG: hypothetical protein PVJ69_02965 [Desulfobacteraceae bacterium]
MNEKLRSSSGAFHSSQRLDGFSAERAETEPRLQPFTTIGTARALPPLLIPMPHLTRFMGQTATTLALQKWVALFYSNKGQEKYGEVMIHPLGQGLVKATGRTSPGMTF